MTSKIEQLIGEIEDYISTCSYQTFSNTRIIVNKDQIDELLVNLRASTPDEIKRYQKLISNRDAILDDARKKAEALLNQAQIQTAQLVNEHEIMQQAYSKANDIVTMATHQAQEILDNATSEANSLKEAAMRYTDDLLANLEKIITYTAETSTANFNELIGNLNSCNGIVKNNRKELQPNNDEFAPMDIEDIETEE